MVWKGIKFFLLFCKACLSIGRYNFFLFQMGKKQNTSSWFALALCVRRSLKCIMLFYVAQTTRRKLSVLNLCWEWTFSCYQSFALGGNLMEALLSLNDSEMFNFLLATYAKRILLFFFLSSFQSFVWFMKVTNSHKRRNKICSVIHWSCSSQLVLCVLQFAVQWKWHNFIGKCQFCFV